MIQAIETYLTMRRAVGFELLNADYLLRSFARFAAARRETNVRIASAIEWASLSGTVAQRDERLKTICRFVRYMRAEDDRHELPPSDHFGYRKTRRIPHIYSNAEICLLMDSALQLKPADSLRPHSYQRIGQHMLALATYMGHANIYDTYWYLETTPELLRDVADAGEAFYCGGQP